MRAIKFITKRISVLLLAIGVLLASCTESEPDAIPVTGVILDQTSLTLTEGEQETLVATVSPKEATNKDVLWSTSNKKVATVEEGIVSAVGAGEAVITVTTDDGGKTATCSVNVKAAVVPVSSVALGCTELKLSEGEEYTLVVSILPENATDKSIEWASSDNNVVSVEDGLLKAIKAGDATIIATNKSSGCQAKCEISVEEKRIAVTGISLDRVSITLTEGEETTLVSTIAPENATDKSVIWESSNESVAIVSETGLVKAISAGNAGITATTMDGGKTATCAVAVDIALAAITGEVSHVSCRNAEIAGKANLPKTTSTDLSFGILYSTSSGVLVGTATQIVAKSFDSEYSYSVNTGILEPETTYYYRSYITQAGEITYGDVKSFKTLPVSSLIQTLDVTEINPKDAVLNAMLDLTDCKYDGLEYGFEVTPEGGSAYAVKSSNHSEKKFSTKDESLSRDSMYSAVAYVKLDERTYMGEVKAFSSASVQATISAESSDLSYHSAAISGKLTVTSKGTFTKSAVLYYSRTANTLDALKSNGTKKTLTLGSDGSYSINLSALVSDTRYNYVVVSKVDDIEFITEVKFFKTLYMEILASVSAESSDVTYKTATISGKLTVESEGTFIKSALLYISRTASTLEALKSNGTKKTLNLSSDGSYSINLSALVSDTQYNFVVCAKVDNAEFNKGVISFKTLAPPSGSVDLGLSVLWGNCNIGASKPEEYGGYYQWAGTTDVTDTNIYLDSSNCPYHTGSSYLSGWTKYNTQPSYGTVDNNTVLDPSDDVAHVKLGGKWRTPTIEEWKELTNTSNCSWTWTSINGINGYKVQSKKTGLTNKWIFLPAAGFRLDNYLNNVGSIGEYWSSSLNTDRPYSAYYIIYFYSGPVDTDNRYNNNRYSGRTVRPVSD